VYALSAYADGAYQTESGTERSIAKDTANGDNTTKRDTGVNGTSGASVSTEISSPTASQVQYSSVPSSTASSVQAAVAITPNAKVDLHDPAPFSIRKNTAKADKEAESMLEDGHQDVSLTCYGNGVCLVKISGYYSVSPETNKVVINDIFSEMVEGSLHVRGAAAITHYEVQQKKLSRNNLFLAAVGDDVFFQIFRSGDLKKGKLVSVSQENEALFAIVEHEQRCFVIPADMCIAVGQSVLGYNWKSELHLFLTEASVGKTKIDLSYLIKDIHYRHICLVELSEQLDQARLIAAASLRNNTDSDLKDISVSFDASSPPTSPEECSNGAKLVEKSNLHHCPHRVSLMKKSDTICVLKETKDYRPKQECLVELALDKLSDDKAIEIPVINRIVIENMRRFGMVSEIPNSELLVFQMVDGERCFRGRQALCITNQNDSVVLKIGETATVSAQAQRTDYRKRSEKQSEYGVRINIQNNRSTEVDVVVAVVPENRQWQCLKSSIDPQKTYGLSWRIGLKPGEKSEFHTRIRDNV
jgi:hypothetical protein